MSAHAHPQEQSLPPAVAWCDGRVRLLDQSRLPEAVTFIESAEAAVIAEAIRSMRVRGASTGVRVANPAFDVTPHGLISAIVMERGVHRAPLGAALGAAAQAPEQEPTRA